MVDQKVWLAGVFDRAAPTYDRVGEAYHADFAERLLDLAALRSDTHLLDIACGRGAVLAAAAERGIGRLTGIDVSPAMIELAGTDLRAAGITDVDLRVMDAEQLGIPRCPVRCTHRCLCPVLPPTTRAGGCRVPSGAPARRCPGRVDLG